MRGRDCLGFPDKYSWVPDTFNGQGQALIYDANYQQKPAYAAVHNALAGSPPSGGCTAVPTVQSQWGEGYVIQPATVTNTSISPITGWEVTFTLPAGHAIVGSWNAIVTLNGQTVTARNMSYNGSLSAGAATSFGFQASRPNGNTALPGGDFRVQCG